MAATKSKLLVKLGIKSEYSFDKPNRQVEAQQIMSQAIWAKEDTDKATKTRRRKSSPAIGHMSTLSGGADQSNVKLTKMSDSEDEFYRLPLSIRNTPSSSTSLTSSLSSLSHRSTKSDTRFNSRAAIRRSHHSQPFNHTEEEEAITASEPSSPIGSPMIQSKGLLVRKSKSLSSSKQNRISLVF